MLEFTQNVFFCAYWLYFDSKYDDFTHGSHFESWLMAIKNYFISSLTWKSIGKISYICIHILTSTSTLLKRIFWVFFHCGTIDIIISYKGCTAQMVKNPPANAGDLSSIPELGRSPGAEKGYPLSILACRSPQTEEPGRLQSTGSQRVRHDWATNIS